MHRTLAKLATDEKMVLHRRDYPLFLKGFRGECVTVVNRAGLFVLIGRSNKPEAKRFQHWLNHEVLPSIMDTGKYEMPGRKEASSTDQGLGTLTGSAPG